MKARNSPPWMRDFLPALELISLGQNENHGVASGMGIRRDDIRLDCLPFSELDGSTC